MPCGWGQVMFCFSFQYVFPRRDFFFEYSFLREQYYIDVRVITTTCMCYRRAMLLWQCWCNNNVLLLSETARALLWVMVTSSVSYSCNSEQM